MGFALSQLGFANSKRFGEIVGTLGLEPRHFGMLRAIGIEDGQSQQAVAERLSIPPSTMVALVDQLESKGLVERRIHQADRRTRTLHLTPAGTELTARAFALAQEWEETICSGLALSERTALIDVLARVARNIGLTSGGLPDEGSGARPPEV